MSTRSTERALLQLRVRRLSCYGIAQKEPDGPKLVKAQEPETLDKAKNVSSAWHVIDL
jgi:hypothetical protein